MAKLILGCEVDDERDPLPFSGKALQNIDFEDYKDNLVEISPEKLGNHTAIIAQSGSGKSYFMGRLMEEIVLRSNINCLVIDPNADYRNFHIIKKPDEESNIWENVYLPKPRIWRITQEITKNDKSRVNDFLENWEKTIQPEIKIIRGDVQSDCYPYEKIKTYWSDLSPQLFSSELDPIERTEFILLHNLVKWFGIITWLKFWIHEKVELNPETTIIGLLNEIKKDIISMNAKGTPHLKGEQGYYIQKIDALLDRGIHLEEICNEVERLIRINFTRNQKRINDLPYSIKTKIISNKKIDIYPYLINKLHTTQLISDRILYFYESKYKELSASNLFIDNPLYRTQFNRQLCIFDMPSFENKETRMLILGQLIDDIYQQSRFDWSVAMSGRSKKDNRKPKIIVIEEAHNLLPIEVENQSEYHIREKLRTIAAEGRKYGLFLLLISQRPDKLDPKILSECKNVGVMRINNGKTINDISENFGLDDFKDRLLKARELQTGRIMLFGEWAEKQGMVFYGATRRTVEGGKKIPSVNYQKSDSE